jgi:hypothetical protein
MRIVDVSEEDPFSSRNDRTRVIVWNVVELGYNKQLETETNSKTCNWSGQRNHAPDCHLHTRQTMTNTAAINLFSRTIFPEKKGVSLKF